MSAIRDHVLGASRAGRPIHQTAQFFAESFGVSLENATADLDNLVADGKLEPRFWVHCPQCDAGVLSMLTDPSGWEWCEGCGHRFAVESRVTKAYVLRARTPVRIEDLEGLAPGSDLDMLVAVARGVVPCDGWVPANLGSAGGPVLVGTLCFHAAGACWPGVRGTLGGVPHFSTQRQHLSLADLPHGTTLRYDGYAWYIRIPGVVEFHSKTEAHALALAVLAARQPPKWDDKNRWRTGWREYAAEIEINPDDDPWTPEKLHVLRSYARAVARDTACNCPASKETETFRARLDDIPPKVLARVVERARQDGMADRY